MLVYVYDVCAVNTSSEFGEFLQVLASLTTNFSKLSAIQSKSDGDDSDSETEDNMGVSKEEVQVCCVPTNLLYMVLKLSCLHTVDS